MRKMIVTHMYLQSIWDEGKPDVVYSTRKDFLSFEEWYSDRSKLRVCMVQTLKEVSIQSLHVMLQDTDMHDEEAVQEAMVPFRPLDGNVCAEVELHITRYKKDLYKSHKDNVTVSGTDDIARAVKQVMGVEDSEWCEAVTAQTIIAKTNVGVRVQEMSSHAIELQLDFTASMRFSTPNYYKTVSGFGDRGYADSSGMFVCVY